MSETILTKGWPKPSGKCDMCNDRIATHWFGDTSVALCDGNDCATRNQANWDEMIEQEKQDMDYE